MFHLAKRASDAYYSMEPEAKRARGSLGVAIVTGGSRGIGSAIQRQLIQQARQQGDCHLVAKVVASNSDSVEFHQRHGYRIVGTQQRIGKLRNTWFDVVILELNLR